MVTEEIETTISPQQKNLKNHQSLCKCFELVYGSDGETGPYWEVKTMEGVQYFKEYFLPDDSPTD